MDIGKLKSVKGGYVLALNLMPDGCCRTIKVQYHQTSAANLLYTGTYGATGMMFIKVNDKNKTSNE